MSAFRNNSLYRMNFFKSSESDARLLRAQPRTSLLGAVHYSNLRSSSDCFSRYRTSDPTTNKPENCLSPTQLQNLGGEIPFDSTQGLQLSPTSENSQNYKTFGPIERQHSNHIRVWVQGVFERFQSKDIVVKDSFQVC